MALLSDDFLREFYNNNSLTQIDTTGSKTDLGGNTREEYLQAPTSLTQQQPAPAIAPMATAPDPSTTLSDPGTIQEFLSREEERIAAEAEAQAAGEKYGDLLTATATPVPPTDPTVSSPTGTPGTTPSLRPQELADGSDNQVTTPPNIKEEPISTPPGTPVATVTDGAGGGGSSGGEEDLPYGLKNLADFLAARLNTPGPYSDEEIQGLRSAWASDRDRRQGEAISDVTGNAARRGVFFGSPLTSGIGEVRQGFERDTLQFENELIDKIVQAREGRTNSTVQSALQFLGLANNEEQARNQLALAAAQIAQAGGIDPNSVLALLMGMGDGSGGGIDPQLYALLGNLFQGNRT